jgi:hypothetical protein
MLALAKIGRNDVAYRLIHNDTFPSWWLSPSNTAPPASDSFVCIGGSNGENAAQTTDEHNHGYHRASATGGAWILPQWTPSDCSPPGWVTPAGR